MSKNHSNTLSWLTKQLTLIKEVIDKGKLIILGTIVLSIGTLWVGFKQHFPFYFFSMVLTPLGIVIGQLFGKYKEKRMKKEHSDEMIRVKTSYSIELIQEKIDHIRHYHLVDGIQVNVTNTARLLSRFRDMVSMKDSIVTQEEEKEFTAGVAGLIAAIENELEVKEIRQQCDKLTEVLTTLSSKLSNL